jgi:hypothetical protein
LRRARTVNTGPKGVNLIKEAEDDLDAGHVQTEVVRQAANPAETRQFRRAEDRRPSLVRLGTDETNFEIAPNARWRHPDQLRRRRQAVIVRASRTLGSAVHRLQPRVLYDP